MTRLPTPYAIHDNGESFIWIILHTKDSRDVRPDRWIVSIEMDQIVRTLTPPVVLSVAGSRNHFPDMSVDVHSRIAEFGTWRRKKRRKRRRKRRRRRGRRGGVGDGG